MSDVRAYFYVCTTGGHSKYYLVHGTGDGSGCEVYHGRISALSKWSGFSHHYHYDETPEMQVAKKKRAWARKRDDYIKVFEEIGEIPVIEARAKKWARSGSHGLTAEEAAEAERLAAPEPELVGVVGRGWFNNGR